MPIRLNGAKLQRDETSQSLFFNTVETDKADGSQVVYQYWIEDPVLLRKKYCWARDKGLAGVGPYLFQYLDPITQTEESAAMWSPFDDFLSEGTFVSEEQ